MTTYLVTRSCIKNQPTSWLVHLRNYYWCWDKPQATRTHLTHHSPDSGEATTFPHVIFSALLCRTHIRMAFVPRFHLVPKLSQFGLPRLHRVITLCSNLRLGQGLKQTCSSPWELSNGVSYSPCTHRGRVDSWLLLVGSQTTNLTPGPSFAHNLCCRYSNGPCEPIFNIYTFIDFQWYKEHPNARCFDPYNLTLKFWESRWTPKSPFRECECHPHILPKVRLQHSRSQEPTIKQWKVNRSNPINTWSKWSTYALEEAMDVIERKTTSLKKANRH
jgi:hypothetical protein